MLSGKRQENCNFLRQNSNFIYELATNINLGKSPMVMIKNKSCPEMMFRSLDKYLSF